MVCRVNAIRFHIPSSLLLTVGTTYITRICIPSKLGKTMLPCRVDATKKDQGGAGRRKLLSNDEM